jgi:hypothetical protein
MSMAWSPNSRRIAFTRNDDCGGGLTIFAVRREPGAANDALAAPVGAHHVQVGDPRLAGKG